jgi:hypothetical protein
MEFHPRSSTPTSNSRHPSDEPHASIADESGDVNPSIEPGARSQAGLRSRGPYGKRITKDQELLIFQHCLQHIDSYENPETRKRKFWLIIGKSLETDFGRLISWNTLKKRVDDRVLERRANLKQPKTAERGLETVIDDWIKVLDRIAAETERAQAATRKARNDAARDALLRQLGKKRNQSKISLDDHNSLPTGLEPFESLPRDASPEPSRESASASRSASRSGMRSISSSQNASSSRFAPYPASRPRLSRSDESESQLLSQALHRIAESLQTRTDREMQQDYLEQRMRIDGLERRIISHEGKLDQILDILRKRQ